MKRLRALAARTLYGLAERCEALAYKLDLVDEQLPSVEHAVDIYVDDYGTYEDPLARWVDSYGDHGHAPEVHEDPR